MTAIFIVIGTKLKHLKGVPKKIGKEFNCTDSPIISLEDGPQWVGKDYYCSRTKITSLEGAAQWVGYYFECTLTQIRSLEGAPLYVGKNVNCISSKVESLQGIGRKYLKEIGGDFFCTGCPIESHILGLLLVKNLKQFLFYDDDSNRLMKIINAHLKGDRDVLECQEELINNGFKEYAKL